MKGYSKLIVVLAASLSSVILFSCVLKTDKTKYAQCFSITENKTVALYAEAVPEQAEFPENYQISGQKDNAVPTEYQIDDFEVILQMPELPTGCEITAMTMALHYYGYQLDKVVMATQYLPTVQANLHYGNDGRLYGPDLNQYFVGDPSTTGGYICGAAAIITAANTYLEEQESPFRAVEKTGASPEELYQLIRENTPVVVWVTISMTPRQTPQGWYTESGEYVDWSRNDHGAVLIGYTEDTVTIADPISGLVQYDRQAFENVFASRGNQCVVLEEET